MCLVPDLAILGKELICVCKTRTQGESVFQPGPDRVEAPADEWSNIQSADKQAQGTRQRSRKPGRGTGPEENGVR